MQPVIKIPFPPRILIGVLLSLRLFATEAPPPVAAPSTHVMQAGESIRDVASRFMDGPEDVYELLRYNGIDNPASVRPGMILSIPGEVRTRAYAALGRAEEEMARAMEVHSARFAPGEYKSAQDALGQAREAKREARYDQALLMSDIAARRGREAAEAALRNLWVVEPASVTALSGVVDISSDGGKTWKPAGQGMAVAANDVLRSGAASRAEITLANGTVLLLSESSQLTASRLEVNRKSGARRTQLKVIIGEVLGEIVPKDEKKKEESFDIDSGKSSISIRGTVLKVGVSYEGASRISMFEGKTEVAAGGRVQELFKDFGMVVSPRGDASEPLRLIDPPDLLQEGELTTASQKVLLRWAPPIQVTNLAFWRVEVARDRAFVQIVETVQAPGLQHTTDPLEDGRYFWRVQAVDRAGLAGPPSAAKIIIARTDTRLRLRAGGPQPPANGPWPVRRFMLPELQAEAVAEENSIAAIRASIGGREWTPGALPDLPDGRHVVEWVAVARNGRPGPPLRQEILLDDQGPVVRVEEKRVGGATPAEAMIGMLVHADDASGVAAVEWSADGETWTVLPERRVEVLAAMPRTHRFRAVDTLGNVGAAVSVKVDGLPVSR